MAKKNPVIPKLTTYDDIVGNSNSMDNRLQKIHVNELYDGKFQYRDKNKTPEEIREEAINLSVSIELAGEVIEKPMVRKLAEHQYEIISGHTRIRACRYLAEEVGKKEFEYVECYVKEMTDEDADYYTSSSNARKPTTEAELLYEIEKERERAYKIKDPNAKGRLVERLEKKYGRSKSVIGEYITLSIKLSDKSREAFDNKIINKSAAIALASLSHDEQDKLIDAGITKKKDISAYKEEKVEKTVHRTTVTDTVKKTTTRNVEEKCPSEDEEKQSKVVDVLPGQYRVANTDMEIEEVDVSDAQISTEKGMNIADELGRCKCPNCELPSRIEDIFVYYNKKYCMNCLFDLIKDMADTGVISLDRTEINTKGTIVRS